MADKADLSKATEGKEELPEAKPKETSSEVPVAKSDDSAPPLPDEEPPPLPEEPVPADDGWDALWDDMKQGWYFYNRFTGKSQWENPRVPEAATSAPVTSDTTTSSTLQTTPAAAGGYNPAIHGDYDPNADYAQADREPEPEISLPHITDPSQIYAQTATFNRFTGKFQGEEHNPERHSDAEKAKRQQRAFFDVDMAANSHDGRSLKEERRNRKLSKEQVKAFNEKRKAKKEEKRRAWLKD